ncbi:MAG: PD40 domain-containing protein [Betaproteobacteria bacterium]|nr:PD40 domain-containing protein [Betaproteobacteria bacterium]
MAATAPAWSPDGRKLIVTLTKDGGSQLFLINADGTGVQRLLSSTGIDTEASFAPDGQSVLFTSDRGGSPQIYRLRLATNAVERLTVRGQLQRGRRGALPDGKGSCSCVETAGASRSGIQDFATRQVQVLTQGPRRESQRRAQLAPGHLRGPAGWPWHTGRRFSDGRVKQRLVSPATNVREPTWGPLPR